MDFRRIFNTLFNMGLAYYQSPVGNLELRSEGDCLLSLRFVDQLGENEDLDHCLAISFKQLDQYFEGKRNIFSLPLKLDLDNFQGHVLNEVKQIQFGDVRTYKDIADKLGSVDKVRAVGNSVAKNPLLIVVPCHRVIGTDQSLTGYAGGLEKKKWLLKHEGYLKQLEFFQAADV